MPRTPMDSLPPSYDASLSAGPSSPPALPTFACITLNMNDRLRMIKFPKEDVDALRPVIQASWRSLDSHYVGIQSEEVYHGSHEFKLKGYPWISTETLSGACLMGQLIEALYNRGWSMTLASDLWLKQYGSKDTLFFRQSDSPPIPCSWIFLSFQAYDEIRVSNLPKDAMQVVTNVVTRYWKIKGLHWKTRPLIPTHEYKFHGNPFAPSGGDTIKLPLFFLSLFEVLESLGYTVYSKVGHDLSSGTSGMDTIFLKRPLNDAGAATDIRGLYASSARKSLL
ncbi:hypothetical protein DL96DRAFT_905419 [Flagelloscypha sp. PMI_526]|nr:hypothetical protein DL96DRAFT_905419 [Flagelloscypha sp. PMI_526]